MLRTIILVVIALLVLSFFGITIQSVVQSPAGQANFSYVGKLLVMGWDWFLSFIQSKATTLQKSVAQ